MISEFAVLGVRMYAPVEEVEEAYGKLSSRCASSVHHVMWNLFGFSVWYYYIIKIHNLDIAGCQILIHQIHLIL